MIVLVLQTHIICTLIMACLYFSKGSNRKSEPKQVMFSDGIRPGGDLTELDGSDLGRLPPRRTGRVQKKVERQQGEEIKTDANIFHYYFV